MRRRTDRAEDGERETARAHVCARERARAKRSRFVEVTVLFSVATLTGWSLKETCQGRRRSRVVAARRLSGISRLLIYMRSRLKAPAGWTRIERSRSPSSHLVFRVAQLIPLAPRGVARLIRDSVSRSSHVLAAVTRTIAQSRYRHGLFSR